MLERMLGVIFRRTTASSVCFCASSGGTTSSYVRMEAIMEASGGCDACSRSRAVTARASASESVRITVGVR